MENLYQKEFDKYTLEYTINNNTIYSYIVITNLMLKSNIVEYIQLPEVIDELPVEEISLEKEFNYNGFDISGRFILPNTIKYASASNKLYATCLIFDQTYPRDLVYNYGFNFIPTPEDPYPDSCIYSVLNSKNYPTIMFTNLNQMTDYPLVEDVFHDINYGFKYLTFYNDDNLHKRFIGAFERSAEKLFECFSSIDDNFIFKYYLYNNQAYIYQIQENNKYSKSLFVVIPDDVEYNNVRYPVVGICSDCLYYLNGKLNLLDVNNIILGKNIEFIGLNAFKEDVEIYLNNKVHFIGLLSNNIKLHVPYDNPKLTLYGYNSTWSIYGFAETVFSELSILQYDHLNHGLLLDGVVLDNLYLYKASDEIVRVDSNIYLLNNDLLTADLLYYRIGSDIKDVIIPDTISYLDKTYRVTSIFPSAVVYPYDVNKFVLGSNIEVIEEKACKISKCHEFINHSHKLMKIMRYGLNINLHADKLIIPSSVIYLDEHFASGMVNEITFEKDSKLEVLKAECFDGFNVILKVVLPLSIKKVEADSVDCVVDLSFEEGKLNLEKFYSSIMHPNYYEFGTYLGTSSNPYAVCINNKGYFIHPDCTTVLKPNKRSICHTYETKFDNIYDFVKDYLQNKNLNAGLDVSDIIYIAGDDEQFTCIFNDLIVPIKDDLFQIKYHDHQISIYYGQEDNNYFEDVGLMIAGAWYRKLHQDQVVDNYQYLVKAPYYKNFLLYDQTNFFNYWGSKNYHICLVKINNNISLLKINNHLVYYTFEESHIAISCEDNIIDDKDLIINGLIYLQNNYLNNFYLFDSNLIVPDNDYQTEYEYRFIQQLFISMPKNQQYLLLTKDYLNNLNRNEYKQIRREYFSNLISYTKTFDTYANLPLLIDNLSDIFINDVLNHNASYYVDTLRKLKFDEEQLEIIIKNFDTSFNFFRKDSYIDIINILEGNDFSLNFLCKNIQLIFDSKNIVRLNFIPCCWRRDQKELTKLKMVLELNGYKVI